MKIHPALTKALDTTRYMHCIPIPLMRHNGKRHDVHGRRGHRDEHRVERILSRLAVKVSKPLNRAWKIGLVKHDVVVELLRDGPAAEHAQVRGSWHRFPWKQKLNTDKRLGSD